MFDAKTSTVSICLEPELQKVLVKVCKQWARAGSDTLREAFKRWLPILHFERLRGQILPFVEARGISRTRKWDQVEHQHGPKQTCKI
jgi:hypothetical protein